MANLWQNDKGLKIIKMPWREYAAATDSWALCACCGDNTSEEPVYFVALINDIFCEKCLSAYLTGAKRYKDELE